MTDKEKKDKEKDEKVEEEELDVSYEVPKKSKRALMPIELL